MFPEKSPSFSISVRVYYEDTDAAGVVYYANYLKFFERCRTEWVRSLGYDQSALAAEHDLAFVVRKASAAYRKPARLDDALQVDLRILEIGRAKLVLNQRILKLSDAGDETLLVAGEVEIVCVQASTFKPAAIPAFLLAKFQETV
jgi:acyl-CoA thioester hydrolase